MTQDDLLEISQMFKTKGWLAFQNWIKTEKTQEFEHGINSDLEPNDSSILRREQLIGARKHLNYLPLDFEAFITTQINKDYGN